MKTITTLELEQSKCTGCGRCIEVCPHNVFQIRNKKAEIIHLLDCMECGACQKNCQAQAISVEVGVGCAAAMMISALTGQEAACGCGSDKTKTLQNTSCCG
ncbi:MAG: mercury methylation ferredoxin HgcB [Candidatus Firestonebacteria bacterium]